MTDSPGSAAPRRKPSTARRAIRLIAATLLSSVFVVFFLRKTSLQSIGQTLAHSNWWLVLAGFGVFVLANWQKAMRFRLITPTEDGRLVSRLAMFEATGIYNMATSVMPYGTGELSYPYMMQRWHKVRVTQSAPVLLVTRLLDIAAVSFLFLLSALIEGRKLATPVAFLLMIGALLATTCLLVLFAPQAGALFLNLTRRITVRNTNPTISRLIAAGQRVVDNLQTGNDPSLTLRLIADSVIIRLLGYGVQMLELRAIGYNITFWAAGYAGALALLTNLFPIQGLGGIGIREAGWYAGLTWMGFSPGDATLAAFSVRAINMGYFTGLGLLSMLMVWLRTRSSRTLNTAHDDNSPNI